MRQRLNHFSKKEKVLGQFLTPYSVADFMVKFSKSFLDRKETAIDPSCGDGVFLLALMENGFKEIWGVDVDPKVLNLIPEKVRTVAKIEVMDALIRQSLFQPVLPENYFDLAIGNPPFSAKFGRVKDNRLSFYELGENRSSQAIEILFIERFIQLVKHGGVVAIIVPESILANKNEECVRKFILRYTLLAIVSLPRRIFRSTLGTTSKTSILFIKKEANSKRKTLMLEIKDLQEIEDLAKNPEKAYEYGNMVDPNVENLSPAFYATFPEIATRLQLKNLENLIEEMRTGGTEYGAKRRFLEKGHRFISAKEVTPYGLNFRKDRRFIEPESVMDKFGKERIERMKRGVGTVTIPQSELKKLKVPIPNEDFLRKVKAGYLEMVKNLRDNRIDVAKKEFEDLVKSVEQYVSSK